VFNTLLLAEFSIKQIKKIFQSYQVLATISMPAKLKTLRKDIFDIQESAIVI
jgi:hypothetical protein